MSFQTKAELDDDYATNLTELQCRCRHQRGQYICTGHMHECHTICPLCETELYFDQQLAHDIELGRWTMTIVCSVLGGGELFRVVHLVLPNLSWTPPYMAVSPEDKLSFQIRNALADHLEELIPLGTEWCTWAVRLVRPETPNSSAPLRPICGSVQTCCQCGRSISTMDGMRGLQNSICLQCQETATQTTTSNGTAAFQGVTTFHQ